MLNKIIEFLSGADSSVSRRDFLKGSVAVSVSAVVATNVDALPLEKPKDEPLEELVDVDEWVESSERYGYAKLYHFDTKDLIAELDMFSFECGANTVTKRKYGECGGSDTRIYGRWASMTCPAKSNCPITSNLLGTHIDVFIEFYSDEIGLIGKGMNARVANTGITCDPECDYLLADIQVESIGPFA